MFSTVVVQNYIPTSNVWEFLFLHILANIFCCLFLVDSQKILTEVRWNFNVVLIYISCIVSNIVLFGHLDFFETAVFNLFVQLFTGSLIFWEEFNFLEFPVYSIISPLSDVQMAMSFSHSVAASSIL
jgi:hypothetical protein